ncbi:LacI family DNA-binding transcriptional regulator [Mucisphaera sp.]|uniref:LacI family DNA-binding transcriptional regulator n=1 Tax=Mucisphaera sp. TaxID=2913024 RepID=UPI003D0DA62A
MSRVKNTNTPGQRVAPDLARRPVRTLSALAKHIGVSPTTVSFVLNGKAAERKISVETVERVLAAARDVNYTPNALARGLRQKRTHAIGVVFPHLRNDWAHRIMQGVAEQLGQTETVPMIVCHHGDAELEARLLRSLVERRVDGILCNPLRGGMDRYRDVVRRGVPLVFLGDAPKGLDEISCSSWDPAAIELAVRHLIELGHRRIAYVGNRDNRVISEARRQTFWDLLKQADLPRSRQNIILSPTSETVDDRPLRLLQSPDAPTAFFAEYDDLAVSLHSTFASHGIDAPKDISIVTMGGQPRSIGPGMTLTTVTAPVIEEGRAAAKCLMALIDDPEHTPIRQTVEGGKLHRGWSTGPVSERSDKKLVIS